MPEFQNTVDVLCGITPLELKLNHRWLQGPEFLRRPETHRPNAALRNIPFEELEVKYESYVEPGTQSLNSWYLRLTVAPADVLHRLLTSSRVWNTLMVLLAWLVRSIKIFQSMNTVRKGHLILDDYDAATTGIVRIFQHSAYSQEIMDLKSNGIVKPSSKIASWSPRRFESRKRVLCPPAAINSTNQIILQNITSFATSTMIRHTQKLIGPLGREHIIAKVLNSSDHEGSLFRRIPSKNVEAGAIC